MKIHNQNIYSPQNSSSNNNQKTKALTGSIIGTAIPIAAMMRSQKTFNPLKLKYKLKDMLILSGSAITGGTIAGMHKQPSETKINKFKEGCFQFINAALPATFVAGGLKVCQKYEKFNNVPCKIAAVTSGISLGMVTAIKSVNKIFDPKDIYPDRKLTPKDCIANADDAIGALTLAKFPFISKLNLEKILPVLYTYCGYRAGK